MTDVGLGDHDFGFALRIKALATTAPLHDLDARKSALQNADYSVYQMAELALAAIDLVTIAMDFDRGARPDSILADLSTAAEQQAPGREPAEHARVASWVLDNLLNVGSADRGFRAVYGITDASGYARRTFDFKLLEETYGADGELYLRASNEAVNVLVGALDIDIESAQIAADLRLEVLISRGRLSDAQAAAQAARYQTIRYGEMLRQTLDATTRDVRNVDWLEEIPKFLDTALSHIEDRYRTENAILTSITETRDTADTPKRKQQAARLVEVVRDCLRRHTQLQAALQTAWRRFRDEQDRQTFTTTPSATRALDMFAQLLTPTLRLSIRDATVPLETYWVRSVGLADPRAVRLVDLFDALITPPTERDLLGEEIVEPQLDEIEEPERFNEATYDALGQLLDLDWDAPQRLSGMLAAARKRQAADPDIDDLALLVVLRVVASAAQEIWSARKNNDRHVFIAVDDGTVLDDPEFGGADMLITRAAVLTPAEERTAARAHKDAAERGATAGDTDGHDLADRYGTLQ